MKTLHVCVNGQDSVVVLDLSSEIKSSCQLRVNLANTVGRTDGGLLHVSFQSRVKVYQYLLTGTETSLFDTCDTAIVENWDQESALAVRVIYCEFHVMSNGRVRFYSDKYQTNWFPSALILG